MRAVALVRQAEVARTLLGYEIQPRSWRTVQLTSCRESFSKGAGRYSEMQIQKKNQTSPPVTESERHRGSPGRKCRRNQRRPNRGILLFHSTKKPGVSLPVDPPASPKGPRLPA